MYLKSVLSLVMLLATGVGIGVSQQTTDVQQQPVQAPAIEFVEPQDPPVPLLWKVSNNDRHLYLLGSFHMLRKEDYPLSTDVNSAFAQSRAVIFELSPDEMASPQLPVQMMQAALRKDNKKLDSDLSPATVQKLHQWQQENSTLLPLPMGHMQMLEPWYVGMLISLIEMNKLGMDPAMGLDTHFMEAAKHANKLTVGLETAGQQIDVFSGMSRIEQVQMLEEALDQANASNAEMEQLHTAWRNGDDMLIWNQIAQPMRQKYPQLYERINVARNDAWVPKLEALLKEDRSESTLVVVGALHLLGEDGVVHKLQNKGYSVERICSACGSVDSSKHTHKKAKDAVTQH